MTTHEIQAFLYTAQDARRAMNALRRTTRPRSAAQSRSASRRAAVRGC